MRRRQGGGRRRWISRRDPRAAPPGGLLPRERGERRRRRRGGACAKKKKPKTKTTSRGGQNDAQPRPTAAAPRPSKSTTSTLFSCYHSRDFARPPSRNPRLTSTARTLLQPPNRTTRRSVRQVPRRTRKITPKTLPSRGVPRPPPLAGRSASRPCLRTCEVRSSTRPSIEGGGALHPSSERSARGRTVRNGR